MRVQLGFQWVEVPDAEGETWSRLKGLRADAFNLGHALKKEKKIPRAVTERAFALADDLDQLKEMAFDAMVKGIKK